MLGFLVVEFLQDLDIYTMVVQLCVELIWTSVLSGPWQSHVLPWGMYGSLESEIQSHLLSVASSSRGGRACGEFERPNP